MINKQLQAIRMIVIPSDRMICEYLDESLLKKAGAGEVVWIPNEQITKTCSESNDLKLVIDDNSFYVCGKIEISNSIRLFINEINNKKGIEINF